jgi:hypothetical protein
MQRDEDLLFIDTFGKKFSPPVIRNLVLFS